MGSACYTSKGTPRRQLRHSHAHGQPASSHLRREAGDVRFMPLVQGHSFSYTLNDLPGFEHQDRGYNVKLKVISNQNAFTQPRRQSPLQQEVINQKCTEMHKAGIIEPAPCSKYAIAAFEAAKKGPNGQCIDLRNITLITTPVK